MVEPYVIVGKVRLASHRVRPAARCQRLFYGLWVRWRGAGRISYAPALAPVGVMVDLVSRLYWLYMDCAPHRRGAQLVAAIYQAEGNADAHAHGAE